VLAATNSEVKGKNMPPVLLAQLIAQLIPLGLQVYNEIRNANPDQLPPIETILAQADAKWDDVIAAAKKELGT
jgi:hypothetical protein